MFCRIVQYFWKQLRIECEAWVGNICCICWQWQHDWFQGSIEQSTISDDLKNPIYCQTSIPRWFCYWDKCMRHEGIHHEGTDFVRSLVQQRFWVVGIQKNEFPGNESQCIGCKKLTVQPVHPYLADLPRERVKDNVYHFKNTGVGYFGPLEVTFLRRPGKHWCCLLTCLINRAVHIELVNGLDADECLMAITRFMVRRGRPQTVISDNGKNFVRAARQFKECFNEWDRNAMCKQIACGQIA